VTTIDPSPSPILYKLFSYIIYLRLPPQLEPFLLDE
jgi:hypothetical protein